MGPNLSLTDTLPRELELVVVATDQHDTLEACVRALHRELVAERGLPAWHVTLLDNGSRDATFVVAERLAAELAEVGCVRVARRTARTVLRERWSESTASTVAFVSLQPDTDISALLAPLIARRTPMLTRASRVVDRRVALAAIGGIAVTALVAACSGSKSKSSATAATTTTRPSTSTSRPTSSGADGSTTTVSPTSVQLAAQTTEGPYYLDLDLVRSDIAEDREGAPLVVTLRVIDVARDAAIKGATVDVWHCDANGLYSGFVDESQDVNGDATDTEDNGTFLRGTQITDDNGEVTFTTIYPGWYRGRAIHIHLRVNIGSAVVHIGQLFFDDDVTDTVFASTAPYASRTERETRNANDGIYADGGRESTLAVTKSGADYVSTLALGVQAP